MKEYKLFLGGKWTSTLSGKVIDDINPANGEVFAKVHTAGPDETEAAIKMAYEAREFWAETPSREKERIFIEAAACLEANKERYREILIEESGSTFIKAMGELAECSDILRAAAEECKRVDGAVFSPEAEGQMSYFIRQPLGVVAGISPFNYPLLTALSKVASAMAAGNTFVLKPASDTPVSALIIGEFFESAGLPKGVLSILPGSGSVVGDRLVNDSRIKKITFTGSTDVGIGIAEKASKSLKKFTLELGGKNPMIVLKDFSVDKAVKAATFGAFFHQGQICMASNRLIVEEKIYDEFCSKITEAAKGLKVGDPHDSSVVIGPLIKEAQCEVIDAQIKDAVSKGARLLLGGTHEGSFYHPTVIADVTPEMNIFYEESFGPVAVIVKAENAEDALRLGNDNHYGLSGALLTNDLSLAIKMSAKMESGMVHINDSTVMGSRRAPFGGVKKSGFGRENGSFSTDEFTEKKWITIQYGDKSYPI